MAHRRNLGGRSNPCKVAWSDTYPDLTLANLHLFSGHNPQPPSEPKTGLKTNMTPVDGQWGWRLEDFLVSSEGRWE